MCGAPNDTRVLNDLAAKCSRQVTNLIDKRSSSSRSKNSKRSKIDRILSEVQGHTRLSAGVSKGAINLDYGQRLRDHLIAPLVKEGAEGVEQAVANMNQYNLLREDLEGLLEVTQWPHRPEPFSSVDSKTKAAFTRR